MAEYKRDLISSGNYKPAAKVHTRINYVDMRVALMPAAAGVGNLLDDEALRAKIGGGPWSPSTEMVASMYRHIVANAPDAAFAPAAVFAEGDCYERSGEWEKAIVAFERLPAKYPSSPLATDALLHAAGCRYRLARRHPNDERTRDHAIEGLRLALRAASGRPEAAEVSAKLDELVAVSTRSAFEKAAFYDRVRHNDGAAAKRGTAAAEINTGVDSGNADADGMTVQQDRNRLIDRKRAAIADIGVKLDGISAIGSRQRSTQAVIGRFRAVGLLQNNSAGRFSLIGRCIGSGNDRVSTGALRSHDFLHHRRLVIHHIHGDAANDCILTHACCISGDRHKAHAHGDEQQHGQQLSSCFHVVFSFSVHIYKFVIRRTMPFSDTLIL